MNADAAGDHGLKGQAGIALRSLSYGVHGPGIATHEIEEGSEGRVENLLKIICRLVRHRMHYRFGPSIRNEVLAVNNRDRWFVVLREGCVRGELRQQSRQRARMDVPAEQTGEAHHYTKERGQHRNSE